MSEHGHHYDQRFVTVNIPLTAAWCYPDDPPVSLITIPEAVLDTHISLFYYARTRLPAHRLHRGRGWMLLRQGQEGSGLLWQRGGGRKQYQSVRAKYATFRAALLDEHHDKKGFVQNPNTGPPISPPQKGVIRVLVTDEF